MGENLSFPFPSPTNLPNPSSDGLKQPDVPYYVGRGALFPHAPLYSATSLPRTCLPRTAVTPLDTKKGRHHAVPNIRGLPSHRSRATV